MLRFPHTSTHRPPSHAERPQRKEDTRLMLPECREKLKGIGRVAVVGGGLAGLMAARRLVQMGVKVTVYEARKEVGGRVLSNSTFSSGRITEEGAELIGSFHTKWLELAREFGLAMISRMDPELYEREGLDVQLILHKRLSRAEFKDLTKQMYSRVLTLLSMKAGAEIKHQAQPWLQNELRKYDNMSVQEALPKFCQISERTKNPADEPLWQMLEFKLVNDEVAPLDEMNFLGLLCKVRGGQGERFSPDLPSLADGYWDELEIFRCADGCQTLATKLAEKIQTKKYGPEPATVRRLTAVTHIHLSRTGVTLGLKATRPDGKFVDDKPSFLIPGFSYVILAIPPNIWPRVKITADGKDADPAKAIGQMHMNDAVKYFSDVKERFWIEKKAAPYGGALRLGQVWEGTDNQTRVGKQGIVLSVFAGPVSASRRVPTRDDFRKELSRLYPDYVGNLTKPPLFSDWPNVPFIKTGYWAPSPGEIFRVGEKLSKPYHDRLFFAGEHTQMDFFGYMEGALRSGERAAEMMMLSACGLLKDTAPKSPSPPILTRAAPTRETTGFEREVGFRLEEHSSADYPGEAESPFLHQELLVTKPDEELEPRAAMLAAESPFVVGLDERRSSFDDDQLKDEEALGELEGEEESEAEEEWEELEEERLTHQADQEEGESFDDADTQLREDEAEFESLEDLEELYGHVHEHEPDQGEEFAELEETEALESDEESDWLNENSGGEESERDEEDSVEVELETPKGGAKKSSLHSITTTDIFMHVYFNKLSAGYTRQQFFDWIVDQNPGEMGLNRFQLAGVEINLISNSSTAVSDFKSSLKAAGSVVVYFGHTVLGKKTTLGLAPKDPPEKKPGITCAELTTLLNAAKAKIVVLAGCATSQCVTKIKGDTVVIVTQSGKDRLTNTLQWAPAIKALLDELLAGGAAGDALAAANKSFAKASSTDSFKMINGDPTLKMI